MAGMETQEMHTEFWWGNIRKWSLGRPRRTLKDNIKMDFITYTVRNGSGT
jgi:hypothetical protein